MPKNKCLKCVEYKRCKDSTASMIFFIIGLIAIISVRAVAILEHVKPVYGKMAWYIGILGFFIYFIYKFKVDDDRSRVIKNRELMRKVSRGGNIDKEDREILGAVLCALSSSKDKINYFIIFLSSALVLILAFYMDFLRP